MIFGDIHFSYPLLLLVGSILSLILVYLFYYKEKKSSLNTVANKEIETIFGINKIVGYLRYMLILFILLLLTAIVAKPYKNGSDIEVKKDGIDMVVVLDVSGSMNFRDFEPSRLQVAKDTIRNFVGELVSDRLGLIVFAGKPISSQPLTFDYSIIDETVASLSTDTINQNIPGLSGTNIGDALLLSKNLFDIPEREKVIILVTDGDANSGANPDLVAKVLAQENITVYSIGIGKNRETEVIVQDGFFGQKQIIPPLNSTILENISNTTNGIFFRADNTNTLRQIFEKLKELQTSEITTQVEKYKIDYYSPFTLLLIILIILFTITELLYPRCK